MEIGNFNLGFNERRSTVKIKIVIDREACQSIASCVTTSPEIYALDNDAKAVVANAKGQNENPNRVEYILDTDANTVQKAVLGAETCPYLAIEVFDENGRKLFPRGK